MYISGGKRSTLEKSRSSVTRTLPSSRQMFISRLSVAPCSSCSATVAMSWPASRNRSMLWRPSLSSSLNLKWDARAEPPQTFHGSFRPVGHAGQDVVAGKLWILFEHHFHRHARREQVQDQRHPDPMPLMQGLPKQMLGFTEILF